MKKLIKSTSIILCLCIIISTFFACSKNSNSSTIRVPLDAMPNCYDPQIASSIDLDNIINNCYEGLIRIDENGNIKPGVAKSWTKSSDGLTYTFNLRNNSMWRIPSTADEVLGEDYKSTFDAHVKASDFVFAIKRAQNPETKSPYSNALSPISNIYAENEATLIIKLSRPSINFLSTLALPMCMPCNEKFFNATNGRYGLEAGLILSNGPYYIANIDEESGVTLNSSDAYKGDYQAIASTIKFLLPTALIKNGNDDESSEQEPTITPDMSNLLTLDNVGYDIGNVTSNQADSLGNTFSINKYKNTIKTLCFKANGKYTSNENVRLAIAHATDTSKLQGHKEAAEGIIPTCCELMPGMSYRANSNIIYPPEYNLEIAKQYFDNINLKETTDNNDDTMILTVVCLVEDKNEIKTVIQEWQKLFGLSLSIKITSFDTQDELNKALLLGNYDIAYTTLTASEFLASDFLSRFSTGSGTNTIKLSSNEYDQLLNTIYNASSKESLIEANKTAEEFLISHAYIIPVFASDSYLAIKSTASNITVRPSGTVYAFYVKK